MIPKNAVKELKKRVGRVTDFDFKHAEKAKVFESGQDNKGVYYLTTANVILTHGEWNALPIQTLQDEGEFYYDMGYYLKA